MQLYLGLNITSDRRHLLKLLLTRCVTDDKLSSHSTKDTYLVI